MSGTSKHDGTIDKKNFVKTSNIIHKAICLILRKTFKVYSFKVKQTERISLGRVFFNFIAETTVMLLKK